MTTNPYTNSINQGNEQKRIKEEEEEKRNLMIKAAEQEFSKIVSIAEKNLHQINEAMGWGGKIHSYFRDSTVDFSEAHTQVCISLKFEINDISYKELRVVSTHTTLTGNYTELRINLYRKKNPSYNRYNSHYGSEICYYFGSSIKIDEPRSDISEQTEEKIIAELQKAVTAYIAH